MEHTEGKFRGHNRINIYYQCWRPDGEPRAILLVVHGMAEHSGRYTNLVNYFVPRGYAVYGFDHQGHGKSEGLRGYVERFSDYLNDLETFFDIVRGEHADTGIFLVGHSMGGTIATAYTIHHQHKLAGLLLSGAGLKVDTYVSPVLIALAPIGSRLTPKMGTIVLDASALSRDQAVVDAFRNDPLVYQGKIRARLGTELLKAAQELPRQMPWISLPILIMHGTADRLSDPAGSQMLYERVSSKDKTLTLYEGFYHEIFNEPEREQVFADMEAWLTAHI